MTKNDFIKHCCEYAEGFEVTANKDILVLPDDGALTYNMFIEDKICYPLLLQRAIEGWNRNIQRTPKTHLYIEQSAGFISVVQGIANFKIETEAKDFDFAYDYKSEDEAKRKALEYVFERIGK